MGNMFDKETQVYQENMLLKSQIEDLKIKNENLIKILEKDQNNIAILKKELQEKAEEDQKKKMEKFYQNLNVSIDNYVDEMLQDEEINSIMPDYIEKKIYKNVFSLVLKLMKNFTESASISFLDQEITFNLKSKSSNDSEK
jgi:hypothetical protein